VLLRRLAPLIALALVAAPLAHADADPASDVLYTQRIYLPFFNGKVTPEHARALKSVVDAAWAKGYPVKVALIPGPNDLGGVYQMYGKPQPYAEFLGQELVFLYKGPLVTVMPQGLGVFHYKHPVAREQALLKPIPIGKGPDGLADAATAAVAKLAGVKAPAVPSTSSSDSGTPAWAFVVIGVGGVALLAVMFLFGPRVVRRKPA
jgi:hypothetical protein